MQKKSKWCAIMRDNNKMIQWFAMEQREKERERERKRYKIIKEF